MQPDSAALAQPSASRKGQMIKELERLVGASTFNCWFRDNASIEIDADRVTIGVKNAFLLSWMQRQFSSAVGAATRNVLGETIDVRFEPRPAHKANHAPANERLPEAKPQHAESPVGRPCQEASAARARVKAADGPRTPAASADDGSKPRTMAAAPVSHAPRPGRDETPARTASRERLSSPISAPSAGRRFADLADFVKGSCNELALTAAQHVCDLPGARYNPLVFYGGVGTGKTHLAEGIYRQIRARYPAMRLMFLSAEAFANFFTQALREHSLPSFRQRFRTVDVLMIDDVDFLDGKRVIQEEFLHTIKQLESHQRQIVLTADRHPRLLTRLSEELITRFISGIVCRIESPDLQTRRTIVARKAARLGTRVSDDVLDFVAQRFCTSVREIEGALNGLDTYAIMSGKPVGLSLARQVLADLERDCIRVVRLPDVEHTVCRFFGIQPDDLRSSRRSRSVSQPRMLAMYLARKLTQAAYSEIGEYFGGRNHSTVMSAEKRILALLKAQSPVRVATQTWTMSELMNSLEQQLLTG